MKILAIGDTHFKVDNLPETKIFTEKVLLLAKKSKPDFICLLGDTLHTHEKLHTIPLNLACVFIKDLSKIAHTVVLVGNHDFIQNQQFLTENHWLNTLKWLENVTVVDKVVKIENCIFTPYVPVGRFQEALNTLEFDKREIEAVFAHQELRGCKLSEHSTSETGDQWHVSWPVIISGHIHMKHCPQENIYYTGSSMQHTFGETGENTVAEIFINEIPEEFTFKMKNVHVKEINLGLPKKITHHFNLESVNEFEYKKNVDGVKIKLYGEFAELKTFKKSKKFKELSSKGVKFDFKVCDSEIKKKEITHDFFENLKGYVDGCKNPFVKKYFEKLHR